MIYETQRKSGRIRGSPATGNGAVERGLRSLRDSPKTWCNSLVSISLEGEDGERRQRRLKAQLHPHRPCRLSLEQKQRLQDLLLQDPLAYGYTDQLWTLPRIACLIKEQFGIPYHPAHVWKLLRSLGWSCQKPQRRARQQNEEEVAQWRKETWSHIKKRQKTNQNHYLPWWIWLYAPAPYQTHLGPWRQDPLSSTQSIPTRAPLGYQRSQHLARKKPSAALFLCPRRQYHCRRCSWFR